jgi:ankyrin repeat protein
VVEIIKAYPAGIASLTRRRNTPLHFAAKVGVESVVKLLVKTHPLALQLRNANGEWPIDRAIANDVEVAVIALFDP